MTIAGVYLCNNQVRTIYSGAGTTSLTYTPTGDSISSAGGCTFSGSHGSGTLTITGGCGLHLV
jgi:hypothetical protein